MSTSFRTLVFIYMKEKKLTDYIKREIKTLKQTEKPEPPLFILRWAGISNDFRLFENQSER